MRITDPERLKSYFRGRIDYDMKEHGLYECCATRPLDNFPSDHTMQIMGYLDGAGYCRKEVAEAFEEAVSEYEEACIKDGASIVSATFNTNQPWVGPCLERRGWHVSRWAYRNRNASEIGTGVKVAYKVLLSKEEY